MISRWHVVSRLLHEPRLGAEVGTRDGIFTERLLGCHPTLTMVAVDSWRRRPARPGAGPDPYARYDWGSIVEQFRSRTVPYGDRVVLLNMDSLAAVNHVADGSLDFVFIDADHSYQGVAEDVDAWLPKVRAGGIVSGHDYGHPRFPGVARAVDERFDVNVGPDRVWWRRV